MNHYNKNISHKVELILKDFDADSMLDLCDKCIDLIKVFEEHGDPKIPEAQKEVILVRAAVCLALLGRSYGKTLYRIGRDFSRFPEECIQAASQVTYDVEALGNQVLEEMK